LSTIQKNGNRFSENTMLHQKLNLDKANVAADQKFRCWPFADGMWPLRLKFLPKARGIVLRRRNSLSHGGF
jgi:hypothetical protein